MEDHKSRRSRGLLILGAAGKVIQFLAKVWHTRVSLHCVSMSEILCHPPHLLCKIVFCACTLIC